MNTSHYASPVSEPSLTSETLTFPFSKRERESGQRDSLSHGVKCTVYVPIQSLGTIRDIHYGTCTYMKVEPSCKHKKQCYSMKQHSCVHIIAFVEQLSRNKK